MSSRAMQRLAGRVAGAARGAAQSQQRRHVGDLPVKPNKFIEEWGTRRENLEHEYRWDSRTLLRIALFAGVVPYAVYKGVVQEFVVADQEAGRPLRALWGRSSGHDAAPAK